MEITSLAYKIQSSNTPLRILLGRGVANHPGFALALRQAEVGRPIWLGVHHTHRPQDLGAFDGFFAEKQSDSPDAYVSACLRACEAVGANVFWPGRELAHLASRAGEFASAGCLLMSVSSAPVIDGLDDKEAFAEAVSALGIRVPRSIRFDDLPGFDAAYREIVAGGDRVCFKPVRGVFGRGFRVVRSDLHIFDELLADPGYRIDLDDARRRLGTRSKFWPFIAMPWLNGPEWSVDCFRSQSGESFLAVPRRKINGSIQVLDDSPYLVALSRQLADHFQLVGLFNCQFKAHNGEPYVLEINPRPAGGVGLSIEFGANLAELALRDALGLPVTVPAVRLGRTFQSTTAWHEAPAEVTADAPGGEGESEAGVPARAPDAGIVAELPTGVVEVVTPLGGKGDLSAWLGVGARRNASRGYLLVSRVLGKHLPVSPARMAETHLRLAAQLPVDVPGPVAFVGLAETATGLGWGVFEAWCRRADRRDAVLLHTTRYPVPGHRTLSFEEVHSHGPSQVLCVPQAARSAEAWHQARTLVVVDDEVTTGRTVASLAAAIEADGVPIQRRVLLTLVHSGCEADPAADLSAWLIGSLVRVNVSFTSNGRTEEGSSRQGLTPLAPGLGSVGWGRIGCTSAPTLTESCIDRVMRACIGRSTVYVVGAGECMHPAFVLGRALEQRGKQVLVQASTRSPVVLGGAIIDSMDVADGLGSGVPFFVHNPPPEGACVIALYERGGSQAVAALVARYGALPLEVWDA